MQVTDVRTILVTAPWKGDPFWALDAGRADQEFWRTAVLIEVHTDEGVTRPCFGRRSPRSTRFDLASSSTQTRGE